jgi:hypothetical protein
MLLGHSTALAALYLICMHLSAPYSRPCATINATYPWDDIQLLSYYRSFMFFDNYRTQHTYYRLKMTELFVFGLGIILGFVLD